ncbi:hypothetical protein ACJMK2_034689 [Sinanodonta woodiana]|uniref:G-protein coupled receptors family 1 profile domain-containing protein n=1 Tax=Sinanodonta woodiana TaxID=1069815 RepID=A0ABD3WVW2_SINWO
MINVSDVNVWRDTIIRHPLYPHFAHTISGVILLFVFVMATLENSLVLVLFLRKKQLRSSTNMFIIALTVCDLFMALIPVPISMTASFLGGWPYGQSVCHLEGFMVYCFGLSSLYLLMAISWNRYFVIARQLQANRITNRVAGLSIFGCFVGGFLWSSFPFLGWSEYGLEGALTSCGIRWDIKSQATLSYVIAIFCFCFIFPIGGMIFCYFKIYMTVRRISRNYISKSNRRLAFRNMATEKKMAKTILAMIGVYFVCWTPYAIVSFWAGFADVNTLPVWAQSAPALIAKTGTMWNPLVYVATNKQFRAAFVDAIPCRRLRERLGHAEHICNQVNTRHEPTWNEMSVFASVRKSHSSNDEIQLEKLISNKTSTSTSL